MRALLALLLMVVALGVASAQERTDAPASIPLPEVASRAERVMADLRQLDALLVRPPEVEAIERELPPVVVRLRERSEETTVGLAGAPSLTVVDVLVDGWEGARQALLEWVDVLTRRATRLEGERQRVDGVVDRWRRAGDDAREGKAPAAVTERVDSVLAALDGARWRLEAERDAILALQGRVAALLAQAEDALAALERWRRTAVGDLLVRDSPPIWSPELPARALARVPVRVRDVVGADAAELADFLASRPWRLAVQLAGLVALGLALRRGQARARRWMAQEESVVSVAAVFDHPFASALLLAALASWRMYPGHPARVDAALDDDLRARRARGRAHRRNARLRPARPGRCLGALPRRLSHARDLRRRPRHAGPRRLRAPRPPATPALRGAAPPAADRGTRAGRLDRHRDRRVARRSTRCRGAARPGPRAGAREPPGRPGAGAPGGDAGEPAAVRRDGVGGVPLVVFPSVHSRRGRVSQAAARPRPAVCGLGHPPLCDALRRLPLRRDDPRRRPHPRHDPGRRVGRRRRLRPAGHRQQLRLGADPLDRAAAQDRRFHPVRRPRRTGDAHRHALEHGAHVGGSRGHRAERDAGRRAGDQLDALRSDAPHRSARRRRLRHAPRAGARAAHAGGAGPRRRGGRASAAGALPRLRRQRAQVRAARVDGALRGLAADPERAGRRGLRGAERGEDRDPVPAAGRPHQARRSGRALSGHRLTSGPTATRVCPDDPGREQPQSPSPRGLFESSVTHGYRSASARG